MRQHINREYEIMRTDKDAALATAQHWLRFIWGVSIAFGVALFVCAILGYRSWSMHLAQKRELSHRADMAAVLREIIVSHLPEDRASMAFNALKVLAAN